MFGPLFSEGFRFTLIFSTPNLHTTGLTTLNCSTAIENVPACNTNKARISPCHTLKYNTSKSAYSKL